MIISVRFVDGGEGMGLSRTLNVYIKREKC